MKCLKCQTESPPDTNFCAKCGSRLSGEVIFSQTMTIGTPTQILAKGSIFAGKYKIHEEIGRGGMGIVYKSEDIKLKRAVALKFLPQEFASYPEAKERFLREAQAAAALDHPNICTIYEAEQADGIPYIAMAYIDGQTLREKIQKEPLEIEKAVDIAIQVAGGLEAAHRKGIVHRDIKSGNIMVTEKGQAKIMDFGLAKIAGEALITKEAKTLGTVAYMSPEQARGEAVDFRTDLWSFGVVLYEMLSGRLPFSGERETSLLYAIVHEDPNPIKNAKTEIPGELKQVISHCLQKDPDARIDSATGIFENLERFRSGISGPKRMPGFLQKIWRLLKKPQVAAPALIIICILGFFGFRYFQKSAEIRWAKTQAIQNIRRLNEEATQTADFRKRLEAFNILQKAMKIIPKDSELKKMGPWCSAVTSIRTDPPGAQISYQLYTDPSAKWEYLGLSPLEGITVPSILFRWRMQKEGYETVDAVSFAADSETKEKEVTHYLVFRKLDKSAVSPKNMVLIPKTKYEKSELPEYYIDKFEVTNKQFMDFIERGGYQNKKYWKNQFIRDKRTISWEEAISMFTDQTGRPGPATWEAGRYPDGQDNYPVSGVSWYEAAAYAEFLGKSLPTIYHWDVAAGLDDFDILKWVSPFVVSLSNFGQKTPAPVGKFQGMNRYGAYDMAGNVREWCWNASKDGRYICGGAWNDIVYSYGKWNQLPPFDRSSNNGIRCASYPSHDIVPTKFFEPYSETPSRDYYREKPVSESIFHSYKSRFSYDKTELNSIVEQHNESYKDWVVEKVTFDAAYEKERMVAYIFLPKRSKPPYQGVIYFPGSNAIWEPTIHNHIGTFDFFITNGRAVIYPMYKGIHERNKDGALTIEIHMAAGLPHTYSEYLIKWVKDLGRTIDYLETRSDIDSGKLAFYGFSWGGSLGSIIPAVEERFKTSILYLGGFVPWSQPLPEDDGVNYVSRIKMPILMLNGKYDLTFPVETNVMPIIDLIGTPEKDKRLLLYETGHYVPRKDLVKECLAWLDKYLGPVKKQ